MPEKQLDLFSREKNVFNISLPSTIILILAIMVKIAPDRKTLGEQTGCLCEYPTGTQCYTHTYTFTQCVCWYFLLMTPQLLDLLQFPNSHTL